METIDQLFKRFTGIARSFLSNYDDPAHQIALDRFAASCRALLALPPDANQATREAAATRMNEAYEAIRAAAGANGVHVHPISPEGAWAELGARE